MKFESMIGERFKERPSDCVIDSHALMLRGGYMKTVANGIYSSFPPLQRITRRIQQIIREEMDAIGGQEVQLPVVMPASLWEASGRYSTIGSELLRMVDRSGQPLVLGMTHEEAAVHLVREYGRSCARYPFMIYQIQTKFRDEARPRGGLIRVREFVMKDAYSFHISQEDLESYYSRCLRAYERIFARAGIPEVITVAADPGMMGGNVSHEFMLLTPVGEDSIAVCTNCSYRANSDAAECIAETGEAESPEAMMLVHTPGMKTIEDVCAFLGKPAGKSCKAVIYQVNGTDETVIVFIRGDLDVNVSKLIRLLGADVRPAAITESSGIASGFTGPCNLPAGIRTFFDRSIQAASNLICGANQVDYHYTGLNPARDCPDARYHDLANIRQGVICPQCRQKTITIARGIEVGNIFQLGDKYTKAMDMQVLDRDGCLRHPLMGCYGIGIGRLAAAVCEAHHDEFGPIWPMSIAPWHVHLCCLRSDQADVKKCADDLYAELEWSGVEVLYDDRNQSAGVMLSDADLLGVPVRVVVSPRNVKNGCVEIQSRDKTRSEKWPLVHAAERIVNWVRELQKT